MAASGGHWSKGNFKPAAGTIAKAKGAAAAKNMAAATQKGPTVATYKEWEKGEAVHIGPSGYMDANGKPLGYEITSANQNDMGTIATHPSKEALQAWAKQQGLKVIQSGKYVDGPGQFGVSAAQFAKASQMFGQKPAAAPKKTATKNLPPGTVPLGAKATKVDGHSDPVYTKWETLAYKGAKGQDLKRTEVYDKTGEPIGRIVESSYMTPIKGGPGNKIAIGFKHVHEYRWETWKDSWKPGYSGARPSKAKALTALLDRVKAG